MMPDINIIGISLAVQWLRLCNPDAGGWGLFLVRELDHTCPKSSHAAAKILDAAMKIEDPACSNQLRPGAVK